MPLIMNSSVETHTHTILISCCLKKIPSSFSGALLCITWLAESLVKLLVAPAQVTLALRFFCSSFRFSIEHFSSTCTCREHLNNPEVFQHLFLKDKHSFQNHNHNIIFLHLQELTAFPYQTSWSNIQFITYS